MMMENVHTNSPHISGYHLYCTCLMQLADQFTVHKGLDMRYTVRN
jgi:hypothetical protein